MTNKKRATTAGCISVILVAGARAAISLGDPFISSGAFVLFPGSIPNLLFFGVHQDWGLTGEITMLGLSALVWFLVIYAFLLLVANVSPKKMDAEKPKLPPTPTAPSDRGSP